MRRLQWLSVLPIFLFAFAPRMDWSSAAAALVITPLLWVPLIASAGLVTHGADTGFRRVFDSIWGLYMGGYVLTLLAAGAFRTVSAGQAATLGVLGALVVAGWISAIVVAIMWRLHVRKTARVA